MTNIDDFPIFFTFHVTLTLLFLSLHAHRFEISRDEYFNFVLKFDLDLSFDFNLYFVS